ncbi:hypothetical protein ACH5RR_023867 [Cinchona calisaya]|uniref:Flavin-containing monooxygenase n=1 Tax=Cinchona calisaya TaxID=153742 RepID=A0ABD2ZBW0_9GENT
MARSLKIAAIGAGVAGLVTARELQKEGHQVTVYKKSNQIGGTWVHNPQVESDPLGLDPKREIVHSSLYYSLQTNLPRHLMGFSDYPFNIKKNGVWRRLGEELSYSEEIFDAVVVCNGHYTQPKVAHLPGIEKWPGKQIHSHNYRVLEPFRDQVVVVIGDGPSATDICQEISEVAKEVHLSSRSLETKVSNRFEDGASVAADIILHCTGTNGIVTIDDNRVGPFYKHIFPPQLASGLSFVGLPYRAVIFFMLETQAKWVASVLSEKFEYLNWIAAQVGMPPDEEMRETLEEFINIYCRSCVGYREKYVQIKMNSIN